MLQESSETVIPELESIADLCDSYDVSVALVEGVDSAREFGVDDSLPALVYFEREIPSVYEGALRDTEALFEWLEMQRTSATVEKVFV